MAEINHEEPVVCPICSKLFSIASLDNHIDTCLNPGLPQKQAVNDASLQKQPNESWSDFYSRVGKLRYKPPPQSPSPNIVPPPAPKINLPRSPAPIIGGRRANNANQNSVSAQKEDEISVEYVTCTYDAKCGKVKLGEFVEHANNIHSFFDQTAVCPICEVYAPGYYSSDPNNTNLLQHLNIIHSDIVIPHQEEEEEQWEEIPEEWLKETTEVEVPEDLLSIKFGSLSIAEYTLTESTASGVEGKECLICFQEFEPSNSVIRMECFCIFHNVCAKDWFAKRGGTFCPIHQDDTSRK